MIKTIISKFCIVAASFSFLVSSSYVLAQNNTAAKLVPVISLLLSDDNGQDSCTITPISVGDVVFDTLNTDCSSEGRNNSFAQYFTFTHSGGPLHIDLISDFPNSFETAVFIREGHERDGDVVTALEDDGTSDGFNQGGHDDAVSSRLRYANLPSGDYTIEATSFTQQTTGAFNLSMYGGLVTARATGRLNDTGIDFSGSGSTELSNSAACDAIGDLANQDCNFGRDNDDIIGRDFVKTDNGGNQVTNDGDGDDGFSFLKVSALGEPLPADTSTPHACVKDNVTGLMWEVKTRDLGLHDFSHNYSWYNSNADENGGSEGVRNGGRCFLTENCDTEGYVTAVNTVGLCGHKDWRMPTVYELVGLRNYNNDVSTNEMNLFVNLRGSFWSSVPGFGNSSGDPLSSAAWSILFEGAIVPNFARNPRSVRLVRSGQ